MQLGRTPPTWQVRISSHRQPQSAAKHENFVAADNLYALVKNVLPLLQYIGGLRNRAAQSTALVCVFCAALTDP